MRQLLRVLCLLIGLSCSLHAHGINGHLNVTDWATISQRVPTAWQEAECRNAMVFGSCFPDTGYAIGHPYGELMHWPPFVDSLIRHYLHRSAEFDTSVKCFIVGLASHGLQDEIFDTFFLPQSAHHDGADQSTVDTGLDALLVASQVAMARPTVYVPYELLIETLASDFDVTVTQIELDEASRRVKIALIDHFENLAISLADDARSELPWSSAHYLDENTVGSILSEVAPTRAYLQSVWARLHHASSPVDILWTFGAQVHYPKGQDGPRSLAIVLSRGVRVGSIVNGILKRARSSGGEGTRVMVYPGVWTQRNEQFTRVLSMRLSPGEEPSGFELSAPSEWQWIDSVPSSGVWFPADDASPSDQIDMGLLGLADLGVETDVAPDSIRAELDKSGCSTVVHQRSAPAMWLLFFLFLGRLQGGDRSPRPGIKTKNGV